MELDKYKTYNQIIICRLTIKKSYISLEEKVAVLRKELKYKSEKKVIKKKTFLEKPVINK